MFEKNRSKFIFAAGTLAGTLALAGCANIGNSELQDSSITNIEIKDAFITDGSTFRHDAARIIDGDGGDNACMSEVKAAVLVEDQSGFRSDGIGFDANGPWIGLKLEGLPDNVQERCSKDKDGIVWVVQSQVSMNNAASIAITPRN